MPAVRASVVVTIEAVQVVSPSAFERARLLQAAVNIIAAGGTCADARSALRQRGVKSVTAWTLVNMANDVAGPVAPRETEAADAVR